MWVLGLCDGHDAGACLVHDGVVVAAVSEERLSGRKRQTGFPRLSIETCLRLAEIHSSDVDAAAVAEVYGRGVHRALARWYRRTDPNLPMDRLTNRMSMAWQNAAATTPIWRAADAAVSRANLRRQLVECGVGSKPRFVDHHEAHARTAAACSGFDEALVLTQDAFGDGTSGGAWTWRDGRLTLQRRMAFPHSPALLYGLVTALLGFCEGDEGKVTGLAATGNPDEAARRLKGLFEVCDGDIRATRPFNAGPLRRLLSGISKEDIAAGVQAAVEDVVCAWAAYWAAETGLRRVALAGGLFANVRLNQRIGEVCDLKDLFVFPHMGDGGLCVGAALAISTAGDRPAWPGPFLGSVIDGVGDQPTHLAALPLGEETMRRVAERISEGEVVAVARGPMEFGPRALGARSLLFSASRPEVAARLNEALRRPSIMPFAPVVREEDFTRVSATPAWSCFRSMTATAQARDGIAESFPVAVHVDGTMRAQIVDRVSSPFMHSLLGAYERFASPPLIINTSFNRHTEPIVADADGAWRLFTSLPVRGLVLGDTYWEKA